MWFKNLQLYRFKQAFNGDPEPLEAALKAHPFRPCGALEQSTLGWVAPLGREHEALVHAANGFLMVCARQEDKVLPASVVAEALAERLDQRQSETGESVPRREREALREQIRDELLPKAFGVSRRHYAYIDPQEGWLVIDAASSARAEALCTLLRDSLGSLPIAAPATRQQPTTILTRWLEAGHGDHGFGLGDECDLQAPQREGSVARCRRQDLTAQEVQAHLKAGKQVTRLALEWRERLGLVLTEDLEVRRLRFLDVIQDQAREVETEDDAQRFDVDFSIMTLELRAFLNDLMQAMGGAKVD